MRKPLRCFLLLGATITVLAATSGASAQQNYGTPEDATAALAAAAKADDRTALARVLGPGAADIASSGDRVADAAARKIFLDAYDAKHQVEVQGDKAVLTIGQDDFPFPIPLVRRRESWHFDTAAGREEILFRRIGRNELAAIQVCLAYVDAQDEYAQRNTGAGLPTYAQRIVSSPGKKDGLYWPMEEQGGEVSPLGQMVANATAEGYRRGAGRTPFHGYYYKILMRQGPTAPGGAHDYVVRGNLIGGFGLVAYPAQYGNSGVMTFLVNQDGTVFEKDLGPQTAIIAERMTAFSPDHTWKKVAVEMSSQ